MRNDPFHLFSHTRESFPWNLIGRWGLCIQYTKRYEKSQSLATSGKYWKTAKK